MTNCIPLPECARHLARLRPGHPAGPHISNLINQLGNYERNPLLLRPMIIMSMRRIEEARPGPAQYATTIH
jgi:hypothetical protein